MTADCVQEGTLAVVSCLSSRAAVCLGSLVAAGPCGRSTNMCTLSQYQKLWMLYEHAAWHVCPLALLTVCHFYSRLLLRCIQLASVAVACAQYIPKATDKAMAQVANDAITSMKSM